MLKTFFIEKKYLLIFILITFLSFILKFYGLGNNPPTLNRDEASLAYSAYSILKTGHDERGVYFPINLQSFGDWKLPAYVYTLIPFIAVFGLEDWVVRLPSAISGFMIGLLVFCLVRLLLKNEKPLFSIKLSLLAYFMVVISPWSIHFSHIAYEAHLGMMFFLTGLILFLQSIEARKFKQLSLLASSLFLAVTLFTYHSYQVFTPLFALILFLKNKNELLSKKLLKATMLSLLLAIFSILILLFAGTKNANTTKFGGLSIFSNQAYELRQEEERKYFSNSNSLWAKLYSNKIIHPLLQLEKNIHKLFSPEFFFLNGGSNKAHNVSGMGNFLPVMAIGLIIGLIYYQREKKDWQLFLIIWTVLASIAPLITFESNHTTRFSPAFIPITIMIASGFFYFLSSLKVAKLFKYLVVSWMIISIYQYLILFFLVAPHKDVDGWAWEYKPIALLSQAIEENYDEIYLQGESSSPYIFILYYLKIDPEQALTEIEYYPPTAEGFVHAKKMGKYIFQKIDWNEQQSLRKRALYIVRPDEIPIDRLENPKFNKEFTLDNPHSQYKYDFWSYDPQI